MKSALHNRIYKGISFLLAGLLLFSSPVSMAHAQSVSDNTVEETVSVNTAEQADESELINEKMESDVDAADEIRSETEDSYDDEVIQIELSDTPQAYYCTNWVTAFKIDLQANHAYRILCKDTDGVYSLSIGEGFLHEGNSYNTVSTKCSYIGKELEGMPVFVPKETKTYYFNFTLDVRLFHFCISEEEFGIGGLSVDVTRSSNGIVDYSRDSKYKQEMTQSCHFGESYDFGVRACAEDQQALSFKWYGIQGDKETLLPCTSDHYSREMDPEMVSFESLCCEVIYKAGTSEEKKERGLFHLTHYTLSNDWNSATKKVVPLSNVTLSVDEKDRAESYMPGAEITCQWYAYDEESRTYEPIPGATGYDCDILADPAKISQLYCEQSDGYSSAKHYIKLRYTQCLTMYDNKIQSLDVWPGDTVQLDVSCYCLGTVQYTWERKIGDTWQKLEAADSCYELSIPINMALIGQIAKEYRCTVSDGYDKFEKTFTINIKTGNDKKPVKLELKDQIRKWIIIDYSKMFPNPSPYQISGYTKYPYKVTYIKNGEESVEYLYGVSSYAKAEYDLDGDWKEGPVSCVYYLNDLKVERPYYAVKIGESGKRAELESPFLHQQASEQVEKYAYYEIDFSKIGDYDIAFSNVKGNGTVELFAPYEYDSETAEEMYQLKSGENLTISVDKVGGWAEGHRKGKYYMVVSTAEGNVDFDFIVHEKVKRAGLNEMVPVEKDEYISFIAPENGYYMPDQTYVTDRGYEFYWPDTAEYGSKNEAYYLEAGKEYRYEAKQSGTFCMRLVKKRTADIVFGKLSADGSIVMEVLKDRTLYVYGLKETVLSDADFWGVICSHNAISSIVIDGNITEIYGLMSSTDIYWLEVRGKVRKIHDKGLKVGGFLTTNIIRADVQEFGKDIISTGLYYGATPYMSVYENSKAHEYAIENNIAYYFITEEPEEIPFEPWGDDIQPGGSNGDNTGDKKPADADKNQNGADQPGMGNAGEQSTVKNGTYFTVKSAKYQVIDSAKKQVRYVKYTKKSAKKITVPKTVSYKGQSYQVVEIASKAFKNMKKLSEVKIGANVKTIGKEAFKGAKKLKTIVIDSQKLKTVKSGAFSGISKKVTVKVPKSKMKKYKKLLKKPLKRAKVVYKKK